MTKRDALIIVLATGAVGFGGFMLYRTMFAGKVTNGEIESIFGSMPTEELIFRRVTLATLLEETPPTEPKTEFRIKNEEGLAALDETLRARGVDPEQATAEATKKRGNR